MSIIDDKKLAADGSRNRFDARAPFRAVLDALLAAAAVLQAHFGRAIGALSIIAFFALILAIDWLRPAENWDTFAYLGVVARDWMGISDPAAIHAFAFDLVRGASEPETFAELTQSDAYRQTMANDPDAFVSMLGMYDVKWLYVALLAALVPWLGHDAGFAINCGASLLMAMSIIGWMQARGILRFGLVVPALLIIAGVPGFAMVDIPDFLTLSLVTSAVLSFDRDRMAVGTGALVLAVLTRPDVMVAAGVLMAAAWFFRDTRLAWRLAFAFALSVGAYLVVKAGSTHPGWWPHVWFSTYKMQNDLTGFDPDFSITVYATAFAWNIVRAVIEKSWLGLLILALGGWAMMHAAGIRLSNRRLVLVSALLLALVVKFPLFPLHDSRVHLLFLLPALLLLVAELTETFSRHMAKRII